MSCISGLSCNPREGHFRFYSLPPASSGMGIFSRKFFFLHLG